MLKNYLTEFFYKKTSLGLRLFLILILIPGSQKCFVSKSSASTFALKLATGVFLTKIATDFLSFSKNQLLNDLFSLSSRQILKSKIAFKMNNKILKEKAILYQDILSRNPNSHERCIARENINIILKIDALISANAIMPQLTFLNPNSSLSIDTLGQKNINSLKKILGSPNHNKIPCLVSNGKPSLVAQTINYVTSEIKANLIVIDCQLLKIDFFLSCLNFQNPMFYSFFAEKLSHCDPRSLNILFFKYIDKIEDPSVISFIVYFLHKKIPPADFLLKGIEEKINNILIFASCENEISAKRISGNLFKFIRPNSSEIFFKNIARHLFKILQKDVSSEDVHKLYGIYNESFSDQDPEVFINKYGPHFPEILPALKKRLNKKSKNLLALNLDALKDSPNYKLLQSLQASLQNKEGSPDYDLLLKKFEKTYAISTLKQSAFPKFSVKDIKKKLDKKLYGLDNAKNELINYLILLQNSKEHQGKSLLLVGPPGVGKTAFASVAASTLNKKMFKISYPSLINPSQLKGWSASYKAAEEGLIAKALLHTNHANPLILIDEIDKNNSDQNTSVFNSLLDVLDKNQNDKIHDNFLGATMDCSKILFVLTANSLSPLAECLLDRFYIICIPEYSCDEKLEIACKFMISKIMANIKPEVAKKISFTKEEIGLVITPTISLRTLEKTLSSMLVEKIKQLS